MESPTRTLSSRRQFLGGLAGILLSGCAPAVLPSGIIMPIRKLWVPKNELLTIDWIGREALRIVHEKMVFLGTINRQFDDSFTSDHKTIIKLANDRI